MCKKNKVSKLGAGEGFQAGAAAADRRLASPSNEDRRFLEHRAGPKALVLVGTAHSTLASQRAHVSCCERADGLNRRRRLQHIAVQPPCATELDVGRYEAEQAPSYVGP